MSKNTASDNIKKRLATDFGGIAKDWKRLSKEKNDDDLWVREYEHRVSGQKLIVTEDTSGQFHITEDSLSETFAGKPDKDQSNTDAVEVSAEMSAAAEQFVDMFYKEYLSHQELPEGLLDDLACKAGRALAGKFYFGLVVEDDEAEWHFSLMKDQGFNDGYDGEYPQLEALLPEGAENDLGFIYSWYEDKLTPLERAKTLLDAGFSWNKNFQLHVDNSQTDLVGAIERELSNKVVFIPGAPDTAPS